MDRTNVIPWKPNTSDIPINPGVYKYFTSNGEIIYVGKAKNLRKRLTSYFVDSSKLHPRTKMMLEAAAGVEWTIVNNELEALQLEYIWIKQFNPKYNVEFKDDKSYVSLAITVKETYSRIFIYRGARKKNIKYFGPYANAKTVRDTLDLLLRVYKIRSCGKGVFNRHQSLRRPCLLGYINKCLAPCVKRVSEFQHQEQVKELIKFLSGNSADITSQIKQRMKKAALDYKYELAAKLRDELNLLKTIQAKQTVVLDFDVNADFFGFGFDELSYAVKIFKVRKGRIQSEQGKIYTRDLFSSSKMIEISSDELTSFLVQHYSDEIELEEQLPDFTKSFRNKTNIISLIPKEIVISTNFTDIALIEKWLSNLRGSKVKIYTPKKGVKKKLLDTVVKNAELSLQKYKLNRATDIVARTNSLQELHKILGLTNIPITIEAIDVSHFMGSNIVAAAVAFKDALPDKSKYKRFNIKYAVIEGNSNDVASIAEVVERRFNKKDTYPNLLIVDGGVPQVQAAAKILKKLNIDKVDLIGVAKRLEEVWLPNSDYPIILPRESEALFLLQRIRDEAHNFAIRFQKIKRIKPLTLSQLDNIDGLGKAKKTSLLRNFKSITNIKTATLTELMQVSGIGEKLAKSIKDYFDTSSD